MIERVIERVLRHLPEIGVAMHETVEPGVFKLFGAPGRREFIRDFAEPRTMLCDSGVEIKQRAVGVKDVRADVGELGRRFGSYSSVK